MKEQQQIPNVLDNQSAVCVYGVPYLNHNICFLLWQTIQQVLIAYAELLKKDFPHYVSKHNTVRFIVWSNHTLDSVVWGVWTITFHKSAQIKIGTKPTIVCAHV